VSWEGGELNWAWPWLLSHAAVWGLVLLRVLGLCLTAPGLAIPELDWRFRIGLAVVLGLVLVPVLEPRIVAPPGWQNVALAALLELLTGAVLGYLAATVVAGARMAGELVAAQAGLSTSTLLDPETGDELGPLGRLYGWIAVVAFLGLGGPLILIKALVESYEAVPAGGLLISAETATMAFAQVGRALELALRAAAPVALALALSGIIMGWLSRTASSLPFVALALPIRTLVGVVLLMLSLATLYVALSGVWEAYPLR
jgi:flagellar biosynthesis protein FliR